MGRPQMWHGLPSALSLALSFLRALPLAFLGFAFPIQIPILHKNPCRPVPAGTRMHNPPLLAVLHAYSHRHGKGPPVRTVPDIG